MLGYQHIFLAPPATSGLNNHSFPPFSLLPPCPQLLRASGAGDLPAEPLWRRGLPPGSSLLGEFQRECATIRRALDGDLCKVGSGSETQDGQVRGCVAGLSLLYTLQAAIPLQPAPHTLPLCTCSASVTASPSSLRGCTWTPPCSCASLVTRVATQSWCRPAAWSCPACPSLHLLRQCQRQHWSARHQHEQRLLSMMPLEQRWGQRQAHKEQQ